MSIGTVKAVLDHSRAKGTARMVLFVLAECANRDGLCWPSVPTIAERCACSESSVYRALDGLKAAGEIKVVRDEPGKVVVYRITVPAEGHDPSEDRTPDPSEDRTPPNSGPLPGSEGTPPRMGPEP